MFNGEKQKLIAPTISLSIIPQSTISKCATDTYIKAITSAPKIIMSEPLSSDDCDANSENNSTLHANFASRNTIRSFDPATISQSDTFPSCEGVLIPAFPCNPDLQPRDTGDVIIEPFSSQSAR